MAPRPQISELRGKRLRLAVRVTAWWLLAQGCLCLVLNYRLSHACGLRYDQSQEPYIRLLGLCLACLGFFFLKALRDPRRQYLAVDVLILFLLGHVYCLLSYRLDGQYLTPWEWAWGLVDLTLSVALVLNRTRSGEMEKAGSLLSEPALGLARRTGQWVANKGPAPRPTLGDLAPADEDQPGGAQAQPQKRGESEALPHLD